MNRAFLSHSSKQKDFVREVYQELGSCRCVFDECCFENGKKIIDEITRGVKQTDLFVLFISDDSLNSDWVQQEIVLADGFMNSHDKKTVLPILIDKRIDVSKDSRIPEWMKAYLMKVCTKSKKAATMIQETLRQLEYETNPIYAAKRNLFVGRYREREEIERTLNMSIKPHFRSIILNGLEGVGRRTLLKQFLIEKGLLDTNRDPLYIKMGGRSTIDNLILPLIEYVNDVITDIDFINLHEKTLDEKINFLQTLFEKIAKEHYYIFIIDDGCIVRPNLQLSKWFLKAIDIPELLETYNVSLISRFRPSNQALDFLDDILAINVTPLSSSEVSTLFNGYCRALKLSASPEMKEIQECLNGIPAQVYYAVEMIDRIGIHNTLKQKQKIIDSGEKPVMPIISDVQQRGDESFKLFILVCSLGTTSYNMIYKIAGDTDFVNRELEFFYVSGVFSHFGGCKEYISVNSSISDYIKRSRVSIAPDYTSKLNDIVETFVENGLKDTEFSDTSLLIHSIKSSILSGKVLPSHYYLPSFTLDAISDLYDQQRYKEVVALIDQMMLNKQKYDSNTIREYSLWLCQSLARLKDRRFEQEVEYFTDGVEYYFLNGFYFRMLHHLDRAEKYLTTALELNPNHQRSKRELVNVYIMNDEYQKGLSLAKENYLSKGTNPFHIQAYFICLMHNNLDNLSIVLEELNKLIEQMKSSLDRRSKSMLTTMKGEYYYYVDRNVDRAIKVLKDANPGTISNQYAAKALRDIYKRENMINEYQELTRKLQ